MASDNFYYLDIWTDFYVDILQDSCVDMYQDFYDYKLTGYDVDM